MQSKITVRYHYFTPTRMGEIKKVITVLVRTWRNRKHRTGWRGCEMARPFGEQFGGSSKLNINSTTRSNNSIPGIQPRKRKCFHTRTFTHTFKEQSKGGHNPNARPLMNRSMKCGLSVQRNVNRP